MLSTPFKSTSMRSSDMRRSLVIFAIVVATSACLPEAARANLEVDRLREALRQAIGRTRTLEDQQSALQARQIESEQESKRLKGEIDAAKTLTKAAEKERDDAVNEFNRRLDERNAVLEKWKSAYEDAATVARAKDAERAKFESEFKAFKASAKACAERNVKLVGIGNDLLGRLDGVELGDVLAGHEPLIGFKRVEISEPVAGLSGQDFGAKGQSMSESRMKTRAAAFARLLVAPLALVASIGGSTFGVCAQTPAPTQSLTTNKPKAPIMRNPVNSPLAEADPAAVQRPAPTIGGETVARVGGVEIKEDELRAFVAGLGEREQTALARDPALLSQVVRQLLANQLVLKEALAKRWDQRPEVAEQLKKVREIAVVDFYLRSVSQPPADFPADTLI